MELSDFRNLRQALDVGRTLTRFNFPQAEVFNPLGILLAHHLAQLDEAQRTAAEGTENDSLDDGQFDPFLTPPNMMIARELLRPESANDEQGGGNGDTGDESAGQNSRQIDPNLPSGDILIDPTRVGFASGNLVFLTESFLDEQPSGTLEDRSSTIDTTTEDGAEVGTSTQPNRLPEGTIIPLPICPGD